MELDERSKQILFAVIQCYISSPGPVGSRVVTKKYSFGISSATIRNIMSDLEDLGFLRQPHTSAGRVPTDSGYRFYVDALKADKPDRSPEYLRELSKKIEAFKKDLNSFLGEASKMLSSLSHYIGITMSPHGGSTTLSRIELIRFPRREAAVVLFTNEGFMKNRIVNVDRDISQKDLHRIAEYINSRFAGSTLDEIRKIVLGEIQEEKTVCDGLIRDALNICRNIFPSSPADLYISGLTEMLSLPDFEDISRIKELLRAIEDKHIIMNLLEKIAECEGTQVFIGSENPLEEMKRFSLVASTYREGKRPIGAIGIIGPTRMNYHQAISIVDLTANFITDMLSYNRRTDNEKTRHDR